MNVYKKILFKIRRIEEKRSLAKSGVILNKKAFVDNSIFGSPNYIGSGSAIINCRIGRYSYCGNACVLTDVKIGNYCSIGDGVKILAAQHPAEFVSTSPVFYSERSTIGTFVHEQLYPDYKFVNNSCFKAIIENDVWIGSNAIIMGGVTIATGAIIAAGAVVTKDVEPYSIVGGVPAKLIRLRFDKEDIERLLTSEWWNNDDEWMKNNARSFNNVNTFINQVHGK